jgi:hypothetical protein
MKKMRVLLALFSAMTVATIASAQTVDFLIVSMRHRYTQTDNSTTVDAANPWSFRASVEGTGISGIAAPTLAIPSGTGSTTMTYDSGDNSWVVENDYSSETLLNNEYGLGNYSLTALSQTVSPISVTGGTYPAAPLATNLSGGTIVGGILTWNVASALTITITGTADHMGLFVGGFNYDDGTESFGTGSRSHTFTVPALSMTAGNNYQVELSFDDIVGGTNVFSFGGTGGMSAANYAGVYTAQTKFTIQAVPEPSTYAVVFGALACLGVAFKRRRALAGGMIHRRRRLA